MLKTLLLFLSSCPYASIKLWSINQLLGFLCVFCLYFCQSGRENPCLEKDGVQGGSHREMKGLWSSGMGKTELDFVKIVKPRLGGDTSALCRYMWKQRGNAVGRGKLHRRRQLHLLWVAAADWRGFPAIGAERLWSSLLGREVGRTILPLWYCSLIKLLQLSKGETVSSQK